MQNHGLMSREQEKLKFYYFAMANPLPTFYNIMNIHMNFKTEYTSKYITYWNRWLKEPYNIDYGMKVLGDQMNDISRILPRQYFRMQPPLNPLSLEPTWPYGALTDGQTFWYNINNNPKYCLACLKGEIPEDKLEFSVVGSTGTGKSTTFACWSLAKALHAKNLLDLTRVIVFMPTREAVPSAYTSACAQFVKKNSWLCVAYAHGSEDGTVHKEESE
ncbi:17227_t:CDS:2, partial [Racocetra persica]